MNDTIIVLIIVLSLLNAYALGRLTQWLRDQEHHPRRDPRSPHWVKDAMDDLNAVDTDALMWIRDALLVAEARLDDRRNLVSQIRSGSYKTDQPASARGRYVAESVPGSEEAS
jgi:hypothetical protein